MIDHRPLLRFMLARHSIYLARASGQPAPWTDDTVLRAYRFCNVYRELDAVTIWIDRRIRRPMADSAHLWFALALARQINWPPTLEELMEYPFEYAWPQHHRWDAAAARALMNDRKRRGEQVYTAAYMLNAQKRTSIRASLRRDGASEPGDKAWFTCCIVLEPLWRDRTKIATALERCGTMQSAYDLLAPYEGWGPFTRYEWACDLRWTRYGNRWPDVNSWAAFGNGARRGLNRLQRRLPIKKFISPAIMLSEGRQLLSQLRPLWPHQPKLELREVEHSLCEFDKYERARLGQGRPRRNFDGG